jgi:hypothetical protein
MTGHEHKPNFRAGIMPRLAVALALIGTVGAFVGSTAALADRDRYYPRYRSYEWRDRDWRHHHPHTYVAPGYYYAPPPVVYSPPPGPYFSFGFRF